MRFIPFSRLREEGQEERETSTASLSKQAAPVQPAGYGAVATGDPAEVVAERDAVWQTMARLPEAQRLCLFLSVVGGFSSGEIADMLDLHEAAVRQQLARTRRQFQQLYTRERDEACLNGKTPALESKSMTSDAVGQPTEHGRILDPGASHPVRWAAVS